MKKNNMILGAILVGLGLMALLNNFGFIDYHLSIWKFWPLFLLIPGLIFELQYFNNDAPAGLLVPGGILTTYGILFMYCSFVSYGVLAYLWPVFLGGVGVGLFQLYYFGEKNRALFYVSMSFIGFASVSIFLSLLNLRGNFVFPVILIVLGGIILFSPRNNDNKPVITVEYENDENNEEEI